MFYTAFNGISTLTGKLSISELYLPVVHTVFSYSQIEKIAIVPDFIY